MEKYNRFQLILLYYIQIDSVLLRNVQIRFIIIRESNTDMYVPNRNPCELSKRKPCKKKKIKSITNFPNFPNVIHVKKKVLRNKK